MIVLVSCEEEFPAPVLNQISRMQCAQAPAIVLANAGMLPLLTFWSGQSMR
jgi:hypothetical protein